MASESDALARGLLARAHSPDSVNRIFAEKLQHRPVFLKPNSPLPTNAREARRKARLHKEKAAKSLNPRPLSARQRKKLGLYDVPKDGQQYAIFESLNKLWQGYIHEILGNELRTGGQGAAAKLSGADFHGAEVEVSRSNCVSRVGLKGIVIKDAKFGFEIITQKSQVKLVPKEGTLFRVTVPVVDCVHDTGQQTGTSSFGDRFVFEVHGDQLQHRPADRASKKFRTHFLKRL